MEWTDPQAKIAELRRQQRQIEDEIARIEAGDISMLDSAGVRDRYQQFSAMARELLADFREVEENFRPPRSTRTSLKRCGQLLPQEKPRPLAPR